MGASLERVGMGNLRSLLRMNTRVVHDRLDETLHGGALGDDRAYGQFLAVQLSARCGIESALRTWGGDFPVPPPASHLIRDDLRDLGQAVPPATPFVLPEGGALGACWALAGSSLGNRVLLAERRRRGHTRASRFLADPAGAIAFRDLLPFLNHVVPEEDAARAIRGAEAVFATFLAAAAALAGPAMDKAA